MDNIIVEKRNHRGEPVFQYSGTVIEHSTNYIKLVAVFGRSDVDAGYVVFRKGDVMTEWFFSNRWYNIFRLQDVQSGQLKGWYCNITRPAVLSESRIHADDLALDVFVSPTGEVLVLDEDEFAALNLDEAERSQAWQAVEALRALVSARREAFAEISETG